MKKAVLSLICALPLTIFLAIALVYFFEDLPMEIQVQNWEKSHPGLKAFYKTGIVHTQVNNLACNFFKTGEVQGIDAVLIYRHFQH